MNVKKCVLWFQPKPSPMLSTTEFSPQVAEPPKDTVATAKTFTSSDFTSNWHAKARKMASETHMPISAGECLLSTPLERCHGHIQSTPSCFTHLDV